MLGERVREAKGRADLEQRHLPDTPREIVRGRMEQPRGQPCAQEPFFRAKRVRDRYGVGVAEQVEVVLGGERHGPDLANARSDERVLDPSGERGVVGNPTGMRGPRQGRADTVVPLDPHDLFDQIDLVIDVGPVPGHLDLERVPGRAVGHTERLEHRFRIPGSNRIPQQGGGARRTDGHPPADRVRGREIFRRTSRPRRAGSCCESKGSDAAGFRDVSLTVWAGEVVGIAGLVGAGQSQIRAGHLRAQSRRERQAVDQREGGAAEDGRGRNRASGLGLVPEDRKRQGLVLQMSVLHNATLAILDRFARWSFVNRPAERRGAEPYFDRLRLKTPRLETPAAALSGGNQQKVVLAQAGWRRKPRVLILDEPTRGIDVGAKAEIHAPDRAAGRPSGAGILLISSELPELDQSFDAHHRLA